MATTRLDTARFMIALPPKKIALVLAVALAVVGLTAWLVLSRPKPPPAPPPPPPKWECGTAYGAEVCERALPPVRKP